MPRRWILQQESCDRVGEFRAPLLFPQKHKICSEKTRFAKTETRRYNPRWSETDQEPGEIFIATNVKSKPSVFRWWQRKEEKGVCNR